MTVSPGPAAAATRISPCSVNFTAFDRKFRRICPSFALVGTKRGHPDRFLGISSDTEPGAISGLIVPRKPSKSSATSNDLGRTVALPASTFARSSRSLTRADSPSAALRMNVTCFSCSGVRSPSLPVQQEAGKRQDRVQRRAELVAHVGEEARLQVRDPLQDLGILVQFGVEGDHAPIRLVQLAPVQLHELGLAISQLLQRADELLVLLLELVEEPLRGMLREFRGDSRQLALREVGRSRRQVLRHA